MSSIGRIVVDVWKGLPYKFNVQIDQFQLMPNHFHGIIKICCRGAIYRAQNEKGLINQTRTAYLNGNSQELINQTRRANLNQSNLGQVIRYFKACSTYNIRQLIPKTIVWQKNYFEKIIRDHKDLLAYRKYISENPKKWLQ